MKADHPFVQQCKNKSKEKQIHDAEGFEVKQSIEMFGVVKSSNFSTPRLPTAFWMSGQMDKWMFIDEEG